MKRLLIIFLILLISLSTLTYAFDLKTYIIQDSKPKPKYKTFNIYEKPSPRENLGILYKKTKNIREMRYEKQEYIENKERWLKDISKNWLCFIDGKKYRGYDEDIHGSKKLYLYWKD